MALLFDQSHESVALPVDPAGAAAVLPVAEATLVAAELAFLLASGVVVSTLVGAAVATEGALVAAGGTPAAGAVVAGSLATCC